MLDSDKIRIVFFKNIRLLTSLTVVALLITFCFLPTINAYAETFVTGSYSASGYSDSSYNQGSDASDNSNSSSDSDNSSNSTNNSDESTTTATNQDTDKTTDTATITTNVTEDQIENQKPSVGKADATVGVIIAIGVVALVFIVAVLLWVKKHKAK